MAVACRAELGGDAGKAGADIICNIHAAALTKAVHLPGLVHQLRSLVHRLRRKIVLGAVDSSHQQGAGVLAQSCRVGIRLRHMLVDQCTGGVGLRQRNAHFMIALKPQRPAEAEHRCLCHTALLCQRGDGQILCLCRVLHKIVRHGAARFCQVALMLLQQLPKIRCHFSFSSFPAQQSTDPDQLPTVSFTFVKSIKESSPLRKRRIAHILARSSVQSTQFWRKNRPFYENIFQFYIFV